MIDKPRIVTTKAQAIAIIHMKVPRADIKKVMGPAHKELMSALAAQNIVPSGPWFTYHHKMLPATFDFDLGVPVDQPVTPVGRVTNGSLPATKAARTVHRGDYEDLPSAWAEFDAWIAERRRKAAPPHWEVYAIGPESSPNPDDWQTELTRPLSPDPKTGGRRS